MGAVNFKAGFAEDRELGEGQGGESAAASHPCETVGCKGKARDRTVMEGRGGFLQTYGQLRSHSG